MNKCRWKSFRKTIKNFKSLNFIDNPGILLHAYLNKASQAEQLSTQQYDSVAQN